MLVLTRSIDEQIVIDDRIRVTVLGVRGKTVRLGIGAPAAVRIDRFEVYERRRAEQCERRQA